MAGVSSQQTSLPNIPRATPGDRRFFEQLKEIIEIGEGVRGDPLDRKLTLRDLIATGLVVYQRRGSFNPDRDLKPNTPGLILDTPPKPTGLTVSPGIGIIMLDWDSAYAKYINHSHTNIYRSPDDNFANASIVLQSAGTVVVDSVPYQIVDENTGALQGYYYWITFVSEAGIEGPPNAVAGTYGEPLNDPEYMLERLTGQITESQLAQQLLGRINLIDEPVTGLVDRLAQEIQDRAQEDDTIRLDVSRVEQQRKAKDSDLDALVQYIGERLLLLQQRIDNTDQGRSIEQIADRLNTLRVRTVARLSDVEVDLSVSKQEILTLQQRVEEVDGGVAISQLAEDVSILEAEFNITRDDYTQFASATIGRMDTVETILNPATGEYSATSNAITDITSAIGPYSANIIQQFGTVADRLTGAEASYTLKLQTVADPGGGNEKKYIAGWGIAVSTDEFDPGIHSEAVFAVNRFSVIDPDNPIQPLQFVAEGGIVYMHGASIKAATVGTAQIEDLAVTSAKIAALAVGEAQIDTAAITSAKIANIVQSDNYQAGAAGWLLNKNGFLEANNIFARGDISATSLGAAKIVQTAHIGDAAVNTLQLAGQAVSIPSGTTLSAPIGFSAGSGVVNVLTHYHPGTGNPYIFNGGVGIDMRAASLGIGDWIVVDILIYENGAELYRGFNAVILTDESPAAAGYNRVAFDYKAFNHYRPGVNGTVTYDIKIEVRRNGSHNFQLGNVFTANFVTLELKR